MHYYQFNIGDYQSHTGHLDEFEDLAYRRMLDWCYLHEKPLPKDPSEVARLIRMRTHCESIANVLREFFQQTNAGWVSERIEREIQQVREKSQKAQQNARVRWDAVAMRTHSEGNAIQDPRSNTQVKEKVQKEKVTRPIDVQPDTWDAFLAARRLSKAIVTDRVLRTIRAEADKAGWSLDSALAEVAARGWRGFKAEWVGSGSRQKTAQERDAAVLGALTRGIVGGADAKFLK